VLLKDKLSGFLAVATAISPWSITSWTRWLPNPVDVPVMKKTRGIMADVENSLLILPVKPVNLNITYLQKTGRGPIHIACRPQDPPTSETPSWTALSFI
jgi:hypothetical protein